MDSWTGGNGPDSSGARRTTGGRARIDQLVGQIQADPQNVYFEIEGHTEPYRVRERPSYLSLAAGVSSIRAAGHRLHLSRAANRSMWAKWCRQCQA